MTLEELQRLHEAATKAPWTAWTKGTTVHYGNGIEINEHHMLVGSDGEVCDCDNFDLDRNQCVANAELTAAARNALPKLLAVAKAAKEMLKHTERAWDGELDIEDSTAARIELTRLDKALAEMEAP